MSLSSHFRSPLGATFRLPAGTGMSKMAFSKYHPTPRASLLSVHLQRAPENLKTKSVGGRSLGRLFYLGLTILPPVQFQLVACGCRRHTAYFCGVVGIAEQR